MALLALSWARRMGSAMAPEVEVPPGLGALSHSAMVR
jgi:hypothetical protein